MIRADLHVHTTASRNRFFGPSAGTEPWQALARAWWLGLDAVAITDHDTLDASLAVQDMARHWGVIAVPGVEVSSRQGHILALGVQTDIAKGLSAAQTIQAIHEQGGIAVAAHPCNGPVSLRRAHIAGLPLDALETYNARSPLNRRALTAARQFGLGQTGGSDAHFLGEIGNAVTLCPSHCRSWEDIVEAIRARRTTATGRRARYIRHVASGHVRAACRHQRDRLQRHTRKVFLI